MAVIRKYIHVSGRVQEVGFRWKAKTLAGSLGLTGWVKNEWDGSVRMEVQGSAVLIDKFLQALNGDRYIVIGGIDARQIPVEEGERGFSVRY